MGKVVVSITALSLALKKVIYNLLAWSEEEIALVFKKIIIFKSKYYQMWVG